MASKHPSPVPIRAHLKGVAIVGNLERNSSHKRPDHFVVVSVDDKEVLKSEKRTGNPSPRWECDGQIWFHPSSMIKIQVYRQSRSHIINHLVGEQTQNITELLDNNLSIVALSNAKGVAITPKLKIDLSIISDDFKSFMKVIDDSVSRLDNSTRASTLSALQTAFQLTKNIMDIVASAHPILKASWIVISTVHEAVQQTELLDDATRDLAENLREMLGLAKEFPDLPVIAGTSNVIEEIGRTSLKVTSLIHEYTRKSFARRTVKLQLSDEMKRNLDRCQKACNDLKQKFDRRVNLDTNRAVKENDAMIKTIKDEQLFDRIRGWLAAPDSTENYNEARKKQQADTCNWFLNGTLFSDFREKADFLWIKGTSGSGKTILVSAIIAKIIELWKENKQSVAYAYFFFDGRNSQKEFQSHNKLLRSLISQLSHQLECDGVPAALATLYRDSHGQQPSTKSLEHTLDEIIGEFQSVYLVVDSLDECGELEREQGTLPWIKQFISGKTKNLHMVMASRPEQDICNVLDQSHCMDLAECTKDDIETYLNQQLVPLKKWDMQTRDTVKSTLIEKADGMFRWVALQLAELKKCSDRDAVITQLNDLPKDLNETYDRILQKIKDRKDRDRSDAKVFLRFLCFAVRPMTLKEIADAVTVDLDAADGPRYVASRKYWEPGDVLEKCSGLIAESEGYVKLAHFSIKEYLLSKYLQDRDISIFHLASEELAHSVIAQTCLAYLLQFTTLESLDEDALASSHLVLYAAEHWTSHAKSGDIDRPESSHTLTLATRLFTHRAAFVNWVRICDLDAPWKEPDLERTNILTPLYYASLAGTEKLSQYLLDIVEGTNVNAQGGDYGNALQAASAEGHINIVASLLKNGADVNAKGGLYHSALQAASYGGHIATARLLLNEGVDLNTLGSNALNGAAEGGHIEITKLLLKNGVDVNARTEDNGNALEAASAGGHNAIIQLFLESGADVNAQVGIYGNALEAATYGGDIETVKLLLDAGADIHFQGGIYGNVLQAAVASYREQIEIVKLLLEHGVDVNAQGGVYSNALQAASHRGHIEIIKLLLENGADIHAQNGEYGNALQAAAALYREDVETVKLLLDKGADTQGGIYGNTLQAASYRGHNAIIKLLLKKGMDVNARGGLYGVALQAASYMGHANTVKLLLRKGADVNVLGGYYGAALHAASSHGENEIVKILLEHGADVNAQVGICGYMEASNEEWARIVKLLLESEADVNTLAVERITALYAASYCGKEETVQILLEHGADVHAQGGYYGNALQAASRRGYDAVVRLLLSGGADVNALGGTHGTALHAASLNGKEETVKILLEHGADVNAQGVVYGYALQSAAEGGHRGVVKLLLDRGANVNAHGGEYDITALHIASLYGREETVKILLEQGADVNAQGGYYGNALQAASRRGYNAVVKLLLDKGANVNARGGEYDSTALHTASRYGKDGTVKILLGHGADMSALDRDHDTPLLEASQMGHDKVVQVLLEHEADVNAQCGHFGNALQAASNGGFDEIVKLLLDKGANVNALGGEYSTAFLAALEEGHHTIVKLLLDKGAIMPDPFFLEFYNLSSFVRNMWLGEDEVKKDEEDKDEEDEDKKKVEKEED